MKLYKSTDRTLPCDVFYIYAEYDFRGYLLGKVVYSNSYSYKVGYYSQWYMHCLEEISINNIPIDIKLKILENI